jgi:hypothetical protein
MIETGKLSADYSRCRPISREEHLDAIQELLEGTECGAKLAKSRESPSKDDEDHHIAEAEIERCKLIAREFTISVSHFSTLSRYEASLDRRLSRKIFELVKLQELRKREEAIVVDHSDDEPD